VGQGSFIALNSILLSQNQYLFNFKSKNVRKFIHYIGWGILLTPLGIPNSIGLQFHLHRVCNEIGFFLKIANLCLTLELPSLLGL